MLVFRDGRRSLAVRPLLEQLEESCRRAASSGTHGEGEAALDALLRAGELECGLADAEYKGAAVAAALTDALSELLLTSETSSFARLSNRAEALCRLSNLPERVAVSVPEGFAYYALHPLDYADAIAGLPRVQDAVVVGIRTIGTTLSAVARAALAQRGMAARRFTVRPKGHPWDRVLELSAEEERRVREENARGASFFVADEGPGLSGSSFLAVAEALEKSGVPRERLTLVGSHEVQPERLCAREAKARWERFHFVAVAAPARVPVGQECRGPDEPASWRQFERRKILSPEGKTLFKFEGLGHYGDAAMERAQRLAEMGFAPRVESARDGFAAYEFVHGTPMQAAELDDEIIRRLAEYCAARVRMFPAGSVDTAALRELVRVNSREGLGRELEAKLLVEHPVIADAKMQPHEWLRTPDGRMLKTDGASHGDDHFFPGPADIAWDLAGASVEWEMSPATEERFFAEYRKASGDDARGRMAAWKLAYTLFRLGYCQMAAEATGEERMRRAAERYRALLVPCVSVAA